MATVLTNAGKAIVTNRIKGSGTEPQQKGHFGLCRIFGNEHQGFGQNF